MVKKAVVVVIVVVAAGESSVSPFNQDRARGVASGAGGTTAIDEMLLPAAAPSLG